MKNSVKFFLGGAIAAALIFAALAFTNKQTESKEYLVVRVVEDAVSRKFVIQVTDKTGKIEFREDRMEKLTHSIHDDLNAAYAVKLAQAINNYSAKGYKLVSSNQLASSYNYSVSTLFFEK